MLSCEECFACVNVKRAMSASVICALEDGMRDKISDGNLRIYIYDS